MADLQDFLAPCFKRPTPIPGPGTAAIIGAGIAGLTLANELQEAGWNITIFDQATQVGQGGSGNAIGYLSPKTGKVNTDKLRLQTDAWRYSVAYWRKRDLLQDAPVTLIATDKQKLNRFEAFLDTGLVEATLLSKQDCHGLGAIQEDVIGGLLVKDSGYVYPEQVCSNIAKNILFKNKILIEKVNVRERILETASGQDFGPFDAIIVATANAAPAMEEAVAVPLQYYRGHVTELNAEGMTEGVLTGNGYICTGKDKTCIGATFDPIPAYPGIDIEPRPEDDDRNIALVSGMIDGTGFKSRVLRGRTSSRTASPDRMPVCGPVADYSWSVENWNNLHHGNRQVSPAPATYLPGIYYLTALGARGFSFAPYLAHILSKTITGANMSGTEQEAMRLLHPSRFMVNDFRRAPAKRRWYGQGE